MIWLFLAVAVVLTARETATTVVLCRPPRFAQPLIRRARYICCAV